MALSLLKAIIKVSAGASAVYITFEHGVWGSNADSSQSFKKLQNIMPGTTQYTANIPSTSEVCNDARNHWNSGINYTFESLASLPNNMKESGKVIVELASDAVKDSSSEKK